METKIFYENEFILLFHYTIKLAWKFTIIIKCYLFYYFDLLIHGRIFFIKYFNFIYFSVLMSLYQVWILYYLGALRAAYSFVQKKVVMYQDYLLERDWYSPIKLSFKK